MNPERNQGAMTVNALMLLGLVVSAAIPVVIIAILGGIAIQRIQSGTSSDTSTFVLIIVACAIVVLIGVLTVNYFVQRKIRDRLTALVDVCREYAGGERTVRALVSGDDEFARLSMSLNTLLDSQGMSGANADFSATGNDAAALQAQIEKLLQEVSAVGDGDLRVQAEVTPDTLGVLADSFNYMIEELAKVVGRVQATAMQVTNATRRILDGSAQLSQASEIQVSQISQTTEAVEALAVFIQNVARNAQLSADVAQEALRNASSGQQSVRQTIDGMMLIRENVQETAKKIKRLGERSNEIGEIVRIIEDIADQTNLLALNAAIQSAMAGEHGRGFAVVADEIRLLAERSTESTKRIDTLVKSIQGDTYEAVVAMEDSTQEVVKGSQLADEAGRSLNSIYSAVERQAQMIESIARAANEQTSVSEAVAIAMGQISEITRQTNIGTQEAANSVSYLAELSDQLRASVSTFHLPDRANDMAGAYPGMNSVGELSSGNGNQFYQQALNPGAADRDWNSNFAGSFPPLPEPGNSGPLVALSAGNGQFAFNNQQDYGQAAFNNQGFDGQQFFDPQQGFNGTSYDGQQFFDNRQGFGDSQPYDFQQNFGGQQQPSFDPQQGFGGQQQQQPPFNNQQSFGGQQPSFGGQQGFGGQANFDRQQYQSSGGQPSFGSQQGFSDPGQFGGQPGFGNQNQSQSFFPAANQVPNSPQPNAGQSQQQQGQAEAARQRWQRNAQQGQDQTSFPTNGNGNGQFGQ